MLNEEVPFLFENGIIQNINIIVTVLFGTIYFLVLNCIQILYTPCLLIINMKEKQ